MLPQTTANMGFMSVSDVCVLSFLRGHLLCLERLLFSFYLLSRRSFCALHSVGIYITLAIIMSARRIAVFSLA